MGKKANGRSVVAEKAAATIHFNLGRVQIDLTSNAAEVIRFTQQFLAGWVSTGGTAATNHVQIQLELVSALPPLPEQAPVFTAAGQNLPDDVGVLFVYQQPDGFLLHFQDGGQVHVRPGDSSVQLIEGYVTTRLLKYGRLHDLLFTSLSPYLRRHGCYLVYASAAVNEKGAAIFTGPPGCGKSTTILNLALNGWGVLSNDTLLLEERPDGIYALPTPGGFSIRPTSVSHIPALAAYLPDIPPGDFYHLPLHKVGLNYADAARVSTIYFPQVREAEENEQWPLSPAVALARLIEFSLDRWDTTNLPGHINFLERLSRQAQAHSLQIAKQQQIPEILKRNA